MPLGTSIALKGTGYAAKFVKHLATRNTESFIRQRDEMFREWIVEVDRAVAELERDLQERLEFLEEKIREVTADPQLAGVASNFGFEAAREALYERRMMLAMAAAGTIDPRLTIERKARVERKLRDLDSDDVRALYGLSMIVGPHDPEDSRRGRPIDRCELMARVVRRIPEGDNLIASGCIRMDAHAGAGGGWTNAYLTRTGDDVLLLLRPYLRARGPNFAVPGRERGAHDRDEVVARALLEPVPALLSTLKSLRKESRPSHLRSVYYKRPLSSGECGTLTFFVAEEERAACDRIACALTGTELAMTLTGQPYLEAEGSAPIEIVRCDLSGPHDVTRIAADEAEAHWSDR